MIQYIKGDLFSATNGVLAHACNTYGAWGKGVAVGFRKHFPQAYKAYHDHCKSHSPQQLVGTCFLAPAGDVLVACLFTNHNSSEQEILELTKDAVTDMIGQLDPKTTISMPKINAGIFNVPWEATESVLTTFNRPFVVYTLD